MTHPFSALRRPWILTLAALVVALAPASAVQASDMAISITNPPSDAPAYGSFEVEADVFSAQPVVKVEFFVDGELAGVATKRPYRVLVDLGFDNREHSFRVVAHAADGSTIEEKLQTPAIAVDMAMDVQLRSLYVTVQRGRNRALDLGREDFTIYDGGRRQELVTFERGEVPITAIVLLDTSESMEGVRLQNAVRGARTFIQGLRELDQGQLILFSDRTLAATEFSNDTATLAAALDDAVADGGTAVNDHLYLALKKLEAQPGRPVVVLLSDGTDAHSALPMDHVLWKARRSQALVYWIRLDDSTTGNVDSISTAWRDSEASKAEAGGLKTAVEESGGQLYVIEEPTELSDAFGAILAELREQYVLGYYPEAGAASGDWRKVRVNVQGGGLRVRHRKGYVAN